MKSVWVMRVVEQFRSHPTGVRGLKFRSHNWMMEKVESHPTGVRGLKLVTIEQIARWAGSHPTGVRGLKYGHGVCRGRGRGRTPLGCVD